MKHGVLAFRGLAEFIHRHRAPQSWNPQERDVGVLIGATADRRSFRVSATAATAAAAEGAEAVVIVGRDADKAPAAVEAVEGAGAACAFVQADLESPDAPDMIFDFAISRFARVDALVNSATATDRGALVDADRPLWERLFAVNVRAPFFLMQRLVNHLRPRGAPGSIVNILSMHAHGGSPELAVYASTKAALAGLTRNTANAHRFDRIRVNGIALGWVDTPAERKMQAIHARPRREVAGRSVGNAAVQPALSNGCSPCVGEARSR